MTAHENLPPEVVLSEIADRYDIILSDVWGVVHNGVAAHHAAGIALAKFRQRGGTVVLISNSPRPSIGVVPQLDGLGVARQAWSGFVTSGDIAVSLLRRMKVKQLHHIGPRRDLEIFVDLPVELVGPEAGEVVVCSGLVDDEVETPDDYRGRLEVLLARGLTMICANPDKVVERGEKLVYCAGALADLYESMGGKVIHTGKPFAPIYHAALDVAQSLRAAPLDQSRVLAIGDAVRTDLTGAINLGLDCLFLTAGIHTAEVGDPPDAQKLAELFATAEKPPAAWARRLHWD